eukprot:comp16786_c0_seq1/m.27307 comp16786_c0_seq1/g.27307  ORF comp16786_c0_seq1/g.27307 comp16786_c0_seq1/m.27307 type:complete len:344 (-) comp16786_c0_seq1:108-1139(-)
MILTIKLTSFAFNYLDGGKDASKLEKRQESMKVVDRPSVLEFYGFCFWFGGFLAGPSCEYRDYADFIDGSAFKDTKGVPPPSHWVALKKLGCGLLCAIGLILGGTYAVDDLRTTWYRDLALPAKWLYFNLAVNLTRYKYYFAWFLAEGACTMAGLGYNGRDEKGVAKWDKLSQVNFFGVEFGQSFQQLTDSWNINTGRWLKNYVYLRLPASLGIWRLVATHMTSAYWHGFYPGYYMFYACMSLSIETGRRFRRTFRGLTVTYDENGKETPKPWKPIYDIIGWLAALSTTNFFCGAFLLLDFHYTITFWRYSYFAYHIGVLVLFAITSSMQPLGSQPPAKKKTN